MPGQMKEKKTNPMGKKRYGLKTFLDGVRVRISPSKVILFGSRARGDALAGSDYDIIIVSEKLRGVPFTARMTELFRLWDLATDVDFLCYTPEEFDRKRTQIGIVKDAVLHGKTLIG